MKGFNWSRILVIQLGDIGDVVWTMPTIKALHQVFPEAQISILVREAVEDLLDSEALLHRVFFVPSRGKGRKQIELIYLLRKERFDVAIDLRTGDRGGIMARLSGAPVRIAQVCSASSWLRNIMFTRLITPKVLEPKPLGASEQSLSIIRALGIEVVSYPLSLTVSRRAEESAELILMRLCPPAFTGRPFITVSPYSRWSYKEWKDEKWRDLLARLTDEFLFPVLVVGSPNERKRSEGLLRGLGGAVMNAVGETTLGTLAALLKKSSLHIGVDSAPPIIAGAVGTPTITLYGPSDWRDWAPVGDSHRVIHARMPCVPCRRKGCHDQEKNPCLEAIGVEEVIEVIREVALPLLPT